ncbi:hypothetical protein VNO77_20238 [Canavalia gladiata]|uniref:Uncharacterized protein n=1 Tax=Canavalia gladiata TaxID=3824 RepID=A0AAN9LU30_CANGL
MFLNTSQRAYLVPTSILELYSQFDEEQVCAVAVQEFWETLVYLYSYFDSFPSSDLYPILVLPFDQISRRVTAHEFKALMTQEFPSAGFTAYGGISS